jgi:prepilin-type processing-associated H-X9-DG protein
MRRTPRTSGRVAANLLFLLAGVGLTAGLVGGMVWLNRARVEAETASAPPLGAPADELALVPADAVGFAHVRLADLWKSEALAEFRKVVDKAGPDALKALDEGFVPAPSTISRGTVVVMAPGPNEHGHPRVAVLIAFSAPFDKDSVVKAYMPNGKKKQAGGKDYWEDADMELAVAFPADRVIAIGNGSGVAGLIGSPAKADGPLAPAIAAARENTRHLIGAVNVAALPIPPQLGNQLPPEVQPLLRARMIAIGLTIGKDMRIDARAEYPDAAAAADAEKAVKAAAEMGREALKRNRGEVEAAVFGKPGTPKPRPIKELPEAVAGLFAVGAMNMLDEFLANPPVKRQGSALTAELEVPSLTGAYTAFAAMSVGLMLPAVQKVRDAASRSKSQNNLKQMGIAFHSYHDAMGAFPMAGVPAPGQQGNPKAKQLLSWRVHLLPYLEQQQLYQQFKLDEPWDSPNNKKLIERMPDVFKSPRAEAPPGQTYYKVFVGQPFAPPPSPIFVPGQRVGMIRITDGTSNTILAVEGGDPVTWTKPEDIEYDPKKPLPKLALPGAGDGINVLMADGSVRFLNLKAVSEKTIRLAITKDDGMPLGSDW